VVLETGKFNVITAHRGEEALALFRQIPELTAVILHSRVPSTNCSAILSRIKEMRPAVPAIVLSPGAV
jgi:DNA-binding response OmpR family regulator